ncbi:hypothetical protein [Desulfosporosinus meridiei]|uniref:hypothetical protein n=1 Tax=Desulfosporosinus meridiei TaxID=79209 RepID=UPI00030E7699|nr:hypothetical protein [Desulfosporosinus meridiei]
MACSGFRSGRYKPLGPDDCQCEVKIDGDLPERAFVNAWNELIESRITYEEEWKQCMDGSDLLLRYWAKELRRLVEDRGLIEGFSYELMLKT